VGGRATLPPHFLEEGNDMPTNERSKRAYKKPQVRELGSIAAVTEMMMMGSVPDMMGLLMMLM
jgi:hypothetical protein